MPWPSHDHHDNPPISTHLHVFTVFLRMDFPSFIVVHHRDTMHTRSRRRCSLIALTNFSSSPGGFKWLLHQSRKCDPQEQPHPPQVHDRGASVNHITSHGKHIANIAIETEVLSSELPIQLTSKKDHYLVLGSLHPFCTRCGLAAVFL